jgi:hypothetical protein
MGEIQSGEILFSPFVSRPLVCASMRTMEGYRQNATAYVSKVEAARRLGISRMGVYREIARGRLPVDLHGKIPREAFELLARCVSRDKKHTDYQGPAR